MALSSTERISDGPPRGIRTSIDSRSRMKSTAASWRVSSTSTSESCGQPGLGQALAERGGDGDVGADRAGGAAQEGGVAGLEAQAEGVAGDVGAVLVDDRHHAERHPDPVHAEAVGAGPAVGHLADGIGEAGDGSEAVGHRQEAHVGEAQPVDDGRRATVGLGGGHIDLVGGEDLGVPVEEEVGGGEERRVLHLGRGGGQHPAGRLGTGPELGDRVERHPGSVRAWPRAPAPGTGARWQALPMGPTSSVQRPAPDA